MISMSKAIRFCGAVASCAIFCAIFLVGALPMTLARASDDLPIVGDIPMPQVHVAVRVGGDVGPVALPEPRASEPRPSEPRPSEPRARFAYPRGPFAAMQPFPGPPSLIDVHPVLAPRELLPMLRASGYSPLGPAVRRGWVYTIAVLNPNGDDGRLVVDARTGRPMRFFPALIVDARLNDELTLTYGAPGQLPLLDDRRGPRPPLVTTRVTEKDKKRKLADRMPTVSADPSPVAQSAKSNSGKSDSVKSGVAPVRQTASTPPKHFEEPTTAKPVAAAPEIKPEVKPAGVELLPTKEMPDVQLLD